MNKQDFEAKILNPISDKPQLVGLAQFHLDNLWAAVKGLDGMGHIVNVDFGEVSAPLPFPQMLYKDGSHATVENSDQKSDLLDEGWFEHPSYT